MECYGELKAALQGQGIAVADLDLQIAATALTVGYGVVTNHTRHFRQGPGLTAENWVA